jgi:apolipoprotein N-acyltransferase
MNRLRRNQALIAAVLGGVLFALTSPPTDLYPAVVLGLALLAFSVADAPTFWRAFGRGAAWGTAAGVVGLRFVPAVILRFTPLGSAASYLALVLLAAAQSLCWALCAGVTSALLRRARAPLELSFSAGVMAALLVPTVFAWTPAGLVSPWPVFVQLADIIGERGVSVLFAVGAALLARSALALLGRAPFAPVPPAPDPPRKRELHFTRAALYPALLAAGLFAALAIHGSARIASLARASEGLPRVRVGLVSHAVGPLERWERKNQPSILARLRELSRGSEESGAELTVWPEAAYPYPLEHDTRRAPRDARAVLAQGVRGPLLIGLITNEKPVIVDKVLERNSYNSATIVMPDGSMLPPYDKLQLLWFGEMVPGGAYLPWLRRIFQKSGGLIPGTEPRALDLPREGGPSLRIGVLNCYEDTLAGVGRLISTSLRPNLLVNVTNDAWFTGTAEPELHARLAVMRAVELRRDLVRAVNSGVTSWVDASGVVRARDDRAVPYVMMTTPAVRDADLTLYARFGDKPLVFALAAAALAFALRARQGRASNAQNENAGPKPSAIESTRPEPSSGDPAGDER